MFSKFCKKYLIVEQIMHIYFRVHVRNVHGLYGPFGNEVDIRSIFVLMVIERNGNMSGNTTSIHECRENDWPWPPLK